MSADAAAAEGEQESSGTRPLLASSAPPAGGSEQVTSGEHADPKTHTDAVMEDAEACELAAKEFLQQEADEAAAKEQARLDAELEDILGGLSDTAETGAVYVHVPQHLVIEDSPETESMRALLIAHLFGYLGKPRNHLVDVSVKTFAIALARNYVPTDPSAVPPATYALLQLTFSSKEAAKEFMTWEEEPTQHQLNRRLPGTRTYYPVLRWRVQASNLGIEVGENVWFCIEGHEDDLPGITHKFCKSQGIVMRAFLRKPLPRLLTAVPDDREKNRVVIEKLLRLWLGDTAPKVLQLRTNLVPVTGPLEGASEFIPEGLYFDMDIAAVPDVLPSNLPRGMGDLRWLIRDAQVRDFERKRPAGKQPPSRYHLKMLQYFKQRGYEDTAESTSAPKRRLALTEPTRKIEQQAPRGRKQLGPGPRKPVG